MASEADKHHGGREENHTLLQGFEWHSPGGGKHWQWLTNQIAQLSEMGITSIWVPPPTKASSQESNGYDPYDLWDLGEFDTKGGKATKWGTIEELRALIQAGKDHQVVMVADAVLNHKSGADQKETFKVKEVDDNDRTKTISDAYDIEGWTQFDFEARDDQYSKFKWRFEHFTGVDYDDRNKKNAIFQIQGDNKGWAKSVDTSEKGNFDYLMACDIDHHHPSVREDILAWGDWMVKDIGFKGFRFDAVRHFSEHFLKDFVTHVRETAGGPIFGVGEFFRTDVKGLTDYLEKFDGRLSLFDVPLHENFEQAGTKMRDYDLRKIFDNSLVQARPVDAVTFVTNHDTQPGQDCESPINPSFRPLAYALILLRFEGYPCVFLGDLFGIQDGPSAEKPVSQLGDLIRARKDYAYGETKDYFDHPQCIGWTRAGDDAHDGCAVVMCTGDEGKKRMEVGKEHAGETWTDLLGWHQGEVKIGDDGWAEFVCSAESLSVYTKADARRRDQYK